MPYVQLCLCCTVDDVDAADSEDFFPVSEFMQLEYAPITKAAGIRWHLHCLLNFVHDSA